VRSGAGPRVACIGECMVELRAAPGGLLHRGWGGDTLNTAVYLARLGVPVDYVTALGDDPWSTEMLAGWQAEGIGTSLVHRIPGALPGLYAIQTGPDGERRFLYWRDSAAARRLFDHLDPQALHAFGVLYLSGITLSIFDDAARATLLRALAEARGRGAQVVFDTNFRPHGWPDPAEARRLYARAFAMADLVLASCEDLALLYGGAGEGVLLRHAAAGTEVALKLDQPGSRVFHQGTEQRIAAPPVVGVVDTTAAGDSFAAAYLAARLRGAAPADAARAGHALAGIVVQHSGAIIPKDAVSDARPGAPSAAPSPAPHEAPP
jgi:2-dehydro-3-deoxygluconokinase